MIDFFQPENFQTLASFVMWTIGGTCLVVSGLAGWTLVYIINIAGNMAETKTYCQSIDKSLVEFKKDNEQDHQQFINKFAEVDRTNLEQSLEIKGLQKGNC